MKIAPIELRVIGLSKILAALGFKAASEDVCIENHEKYAYWVLNAYKREGKEHIALPLLQKLGYFQNGHAFFKGA